MSTSVNQFIDNKVDKNERQRNPPPATYTSNIAHKKEGQSNEYSDKRNKVTDEGIGHRSKKLISLGIVYHKHKKTSSFVEVSCV